MTRRSSPQRDRKRAKRTAVQRQRQEDARLRALHALNLMRQGRSLSLAATAAGTTRRTVTRYVRPALRRRGGRYQAIPYDELRRPMRVLTERGLVVLDVKSSKAASRLAQYWSAVNVYLSRGDRHVLDPFTGKHLIAEGQRLRFITDQRLLERLAAAGQVEFEDLYDATI